MFVFVGCASLKGVQIVPEDGKTIDREREGYYSAAQKLHRKYVKTIFF